MQICRSANAGLLFNSVYFIVDGVFIGNWLGRDAMAAAGVAAPMLELMIALSMAITAGSGVLVSVALSQKRQKEANCGMMHALLTAGVWHFKMYPIKWTHEIMTNPFC